MVDSLEGIDESQQSLYVEKDGKFVLDVEPTGGFALENVDGLKSALGSERQRARDLESKVKQFGDLDPSSLQDKLQKLNELESIDPEKEADKIAEAKAQAKVEQLLSKHKEEINTVSESANKYKSMLEKVLIDQAAQKALMDAKGDAKTVDLLLPHLKSSVRLNDKFEVEVTDPNGNIRIGDSDGNPMTLVQLATEFKEKFPNAFPASGQSGGGTPQQNQRGGRGGSKTKDLSKLSVKEKTEWIKADPQGYKEAIMRQSRVAHT